VFLIIASAALAPAASGVFLLWLIPTAPLFIKAIILGLPFMLASIVISLILVLLPAQVVYAFDFLGAALGVLVIPFLIIFFREESALIFLVGLSVVLALIISQIWPVVSLKRKILIITQVGMLIIIIIVLFSNLRYDFLNFVEMRQVKRYPSVKTVYAKSSLVGRYDVVKRRPDSTVYKALENGKTIDTIRNLRKAAYRIDPRIPQGLISEPKILIVGLSGDGITKTATFMSKDVTGLEINPVVVKAHKEVLIKENGHSYDGIKVKVIDGRCFIKQTNDKYDFITLLNTHQAKGRSKNRAYLPEYLHTKEAFQEYFEHLTEQGMVCIEEPVSSPQRERPVFKMLLTIRAALLELGVKQPEKHFYVFQWKTKTNNYLQILIKKTPFSSLEIARLELWLKDIENIKKKEKEVGERLGPIRTAKTFVLYAPNGKYENNYAGLVKGNNPWLLEITTDDKPFHFDADKRHLGMKRAYMQILSLTLLIWPMVMLLLIKLKKDERFFTFSQMVVLAGLGFFLVELILIEFFNIFLGSPTRSFVTVLGSLFLCSGLGSLYSGRIGIRGLYFALAGIIGLLLGYIFFLPLIINYLIIYNVFFRIFVCIVMIGPLGFLMGMPFPYILRICQTSIDARVVASFFALNGLACALAVPLTMNLTTIFGYQRTLSIGAFIYLLILMLIYMQAKQKNKRVINIFTFICILLLVASPWQRIDLSEKERKDDQYQVYALNYGKSYRKNKLFSWQFWLVKNEERIVLVDTGFMGEALRRKWGIGNYVEPQELLKEIDIRPEQVTDIILTHAHWDHIGGIKKFPQARIWLQKKEWEHATSLVSHKVRKASGIYYNDVLLLKKAKQEGRLELIEGEKELFPGIRLKFGGIHTPGGQYIYVNTEVGRIALVGDMFVRSRDIFRRKVKNAEREQADKVIADLYQKTASPYYIIPGHDPKTMKWFKKVSRKVVLINENS
jgi:glyoxylase-like metal-dependent hydrolase (beta-lactamase superfamily II)